MSAGFKSVTDTSVIEALDFEYAPPCEYSRTDGFTCGLEGEWSILYRHHCVDGAVKERVVCGQHLGRYFDPVESFRCSTCGVSDLGMSARIIRTERIKP